MTTDALRRAKRAYKARKRAERINEVRSDRENIKRTCAQCGEYKPATDFSWKDQWHKRLTSRCCACRRKNYSENPERARQRTREHYWANRTAILARQKLNRQSGRSLLAAARLRAKRYGIPFDLVADDIIIPTHCPVLGLPLQVNEGKCGPNSPTLDRVKPGLGYVRGNVIVISHRANTIKNDATWQELLAAARYAYLQEPGVSGDMWAALAVAVIAEKQLSRQARAAA